MYGDTTEIRRLARRLRDQADEIRDDARALQRRATDVPWQGRAATSMRQRAEQRCLALRRTATAHDRAAAALEAHATEVERRKELIAEVEKRVRSAVTAARDRIGAMADGLPDPVDELLDRFVPPRPGHQDWLDVQLPGIGSGR
ncbi:putative T7SS-secreted protein [Nocardioides sp.]|uniref:putative T7SS-secreted protein n=1 Tax=Nocardioides sp. TaxID=35761 RepID=UPI002733DC80|nr:hypothetical protein [Nocardioides sp.]MDP3889800.1 hypothetical protein [Nocardioides sp.]